MTIRKRAGNDSANDIPSPNNPEKTVNQDQAPTSKNTISSNSSVSEMTTTWRYARIALLWTYFWISVFVSVAHHPITLVPPLAFPISISTDHKIQTRRNAIHWLTALSHQKRLLLPLYVFHQGRHGALGIDYDAMVDFYQGVCEW